MVELITKQSALDAIDKESEFIEREINDATKHPDEYTDNFISFSRERQCGLADAYIAVDELSPVETMTDDDIISRQAAIDAIRKSTEKYAGFMEMEQYTDDDAVDAINSLPSAESVHGEWVNEWKGIDGGRMYGACCSVCHTIGHSGYNFCPNCGAKMDKGED